MYKKILGYYWKRRIYKNQLILNYLLEVLEECKVYPLLVKDVEQQILELQHLISQAEIQLLKCKATVA